MGTLAELEIIVAANTTAIEDNDSDILDLKDDANELEIADGSHVDRLQAIENILATWGDYSAFDDTELRGLISTSYANSLTYIDTQVGSITLGVETTIDTWWTTESESYKSAILVITDSDIELAVTNMTALLDGEVTTLTSSLSVTAAAIRSEVASEVTTLEGTITTNESSITQRANGIEIDVSSNYDDIVTNNGSISAYADAISAYVSTLNDVSGDLDTAELTITAHGITLAVQETNIDNLGYSLGSIVEQTATKWGAHVYQADGSTTIMGGITLQLYPYWTQYRGYTSGDIFIYEYLGTEYYYTCILTYEQSETITPTNATYWTQGTEVGDNGNTSVIVDADYFAIRTDSSSKEPFSVSGEVVTLQNVVVTGSLVVGMSYDDLSDTPDRTTNIFHGSSTPVGYETGDYWFYTPTDKWYVYDGTWVIVEDGDISTALSDASDALDEADEKAHIYFATSAPSGLGTDDTGDLWFDTDDDNRCSYWDGNSWEPSPTDYSHLADASLNKPEDNATNNTAWEHSSNSSKIDGGEIYAGSLVSVGDPDNEHVKIESSEVRFKDGSTTLAWYDEDGYHSDEQASFLLYLGSDVTNVTGDGTFYTIVWDEEVRDQGSDCSSTTFTAPCDGDYLLTFTAKVGAINAGYACYGYIITSNRTYVSDLYLFATEPTTWKICALTVIADMDEGDTAYCCVYNLGGTLGVDIYGYAGPRAFFSGYHLG